MRPAGHEAMAEARKWGRGPKIFFEAEATMYEAEARHVREQLSVYEHEDKDIGVQNIVFSKQPTRQKWLSMAIS